MRGARGKAQKSRHIGGQGRRRVDEAPGEPQDGKREHGHADRFVQEIVLMMEGSSPGLVKRIHGEREHDRHEPEDEPMKQHRRRTVTARLASSSMAIFPPPDALLGFQEFGFDDEAHLVAEEDHGRRHAEVRALDRGACRKADPIGS